MSVMTQLSRSFGISVQHLFKNISAISLGMGSPTERGQRCTSSIQEMQTVCCQDAQLSRCRKGQGGGGGKRAANRKKT